MTLLIIILAAISFLFLVLNSEYNRMARTPGTKIYEGKKFAAKHK